MATPITGSGEIRATYLCAPRQDGTASRLLSCSMTAKDLADQATDIAAKLKPGSWDSVQALALASIAQSLAAMAENQGRD